MSLLSKVIHALVPAAPFAMPAAQQTARDISQIVSDFREQRADELATLADRAGRSGAQLALTRTEMERWRQYARDLERLCMAAGLEMPPAPDED